MMPWTLYQKILMAVALPALAVCFAGGFLRNITVMWVGIFPFGLATVLLWADHLVNRAPPP